mmetsp:Transcript_2645/g.8273  ORF Transcript_2645/g.8273 Transcript_2645/m.8273 type:complete len:359 (+) Transcript_2645:97-1173(+)
MAPQKNGRHEDGGVHPWAVAARGMVVVAVVGALARPPSGFDARVLGTRPGDWEAKEANRSSVAAYEEARGSGRRPLVVVAGLSRTGTSSLQQALIALNLTVYHTIETMEHHLDFWYYYLNGHVSRPDVRALVEPRGVEAMSDCWFAYLVPEIVRAYPDAKVILGTRESTSWLRSYNSYIENSDLYHWSSQLRRLVLARLSRFLHLGAALRALGLLPPESGLDLEKLPVLMDVWKRIDTVVYGATTPNPLWRSAFERHNAYIRSLVPPDRLLEFNIYEGHGWPELLDFLEVDPAVASRLAPRPFPKLNCVASKSCTSHLSRQATAKHERLVELFLAVALVAAVAYARARAATRCFAQTR